MLLSIEGDAGTAKTTTALTAPLPLVCFSFDLGHERAIYGKMFKEYFEGLSIHVEKYPKGEGKALIDVGYHQKLWAKNDITIYELPSPIQLDSRAVVGYTRLWEYFISIFGLSLNEDRLRSYILDTATIARNVAVNKYLEELNEKAAAERKSGRKQLMQIEYGHPNGMIENIFSTMAVVGKNFIATHHMRDEYHDQVVAGEKVSVPTGKLELEGWAKTHRAVDIAIETIQDKDSMKAKYIKCGYNPGLEGGWVVGAPTWDNIVNQVSATLEGRIHFDKRSE